MVSLLCLKGAPIDVQNEDGIAPIHFAVMNGHMAVTQALLAAGADISLRSKNRKDWSSLDWAARMGHVDIAKTIIKHGADVNAAGATGKTPLRIAVERSNTEMISLLLLNGAEIAQVDSKDFTLLEVAASEGNLACTRILLDAGAKGRMSALALAVAGGHVDVAMVFVEHAIDVDAADTDGCTDTNGSAPLHLAASSPQKGEDMVQLLVAKGANVDKTDGQGWTPLQVAISSGNSGTTQALLTAGAVITCQGEGIRSALGMAASVFYKPDVLRVLVKHMKDVNAATCGHGRSAMHIAAISDTPGAVDVLVEAGANIDLQETLYGDTPLHVAASSSCAAAARALLEHGASIGKQNTPGDTPLHLATRRAGTRSADVVDLFLRWGADENAVADDGNTPADLIGSLVLEGDDNVAENIERVRKLLVDAPADRAWRRRGFLVLCRAHYPSGRVQLEHKSTHTHAGVVKKMCSIAQPTKAEENWAGVVRMLMMVGADPISLLGDGADLIFEAIVGYL